MCKQPLLTAVMIRSTTLTLALPIDLSVFPWTSLAWFVALLLPNRLGVRARRVLCRLLAVPEAGA